jgi:hypothetical protein
MQISRKTCKNFSNKLNKNIFSLITRDIKKISRIEYSITKKEEISKNYK